MKGAGRTGEMHATRPVNHRDVGCQRCAKGWPNNAIQADARKTARR